MQYGSISPSENSSYQHPQAMEAYWLQEPTHAQTYPTELTTPVINNSQYDFANFPAELFQPEEIFQLDQPIKPDLGEQSHSDVAHSPPTLLDLGSGTIHREFKNEDYWNQSISNIMNNDDSNNSSNSRFNINSSPDNTQLNNNVFSQNNFYHHTGNKATADQSCHYFPQETAVGYKTSGSFADMMTETKVFFAENALANTFESNFQNIKHQTYRPSGCEEKYVDMPQYVDYSSILDAYENKINTNERLMNDLDFRINNLNGGSLQYGVENFGMLHQ